MNFYSMTSSINSGLNSFETTVESHIESVKTEGEKCINIAEKVTTEGAETVVGGIKAVGEGVQAVGEGAVNCVNLLDDGVENILKFKRMCQKIYGWAICFKADLEDDNLIDSTLALSAWLMVCLFFQIWMIPVVIIIINVKNLIWHYVFGTPVEEEPSTNKSIKEKMEAIDEIIGLVKTILYNMEWILQKISGFINLNSIYLLWVAILVQVFVAVILMFVPINYLLMLLGISIYSKKFFKNSHAPEKLEKSH